LQQPPSGGHFSNDRFNEAAQVVVAECLVMHVSGDETPWGGTHRGSLFAASTLSPKF